MTLKELGSALGVVGVLSLMLAPILGRHSPSSFDPEASCLARAGAIALAMQMYAVDNGGRMPPCEYGGTGYLTNPNIGIWPKLIYSYHNNWNAYKCVASSHCNIEDILVTGGGSPTPELIPNYLAVYSNRAYNYQFLSPMVRYNGQPVSDPFQAAPILASQPSDPSTTLSIVESIYNRSTNGKPTGPGYYRADPPCFRENSGALAIPLPPNTANYSWMGGWAIDSPLSPLVYGGTWPWHRDTQSGPRQQRIVVSYVDAHVGVIPFASISSGCNVATNGTGRIYDNTSYLWDLH